MVTSAGLQCEIDPVLCQALRAHKGRAFVLKTQCRWNQATVLMLKIKTDTVCNSDEGLTLETSASLSFLQWIFYPCQNAVRTSDSVTHSRNDSCATFLFLPHFDDICNLLLNKPTTT